MPGRGRPKKVVVPSREPAAPPRQSTAKADIRRKLTTTTNKDIISILQLIFHDEASKVQLINQIYDLIHENGLTYDEAVDYIKSHMITSETIERHPNEIMTKTQIRERLESTKNKYFNSLQFAERLEFISNIYNVLQSQPRMTLNEAISRATFQEATRRGQEIRPDQPLVPPRLDLPNRGVVYENMDEESRRLRRANTKMEALHLGHEQRNQQAINEAERERITAQRGFVEAVREAAEHQARTEITGRMHNVLGPRLPVRTETRVFRTMITENPREEAVRGHEMADILTEQIIAAAPGNEMQAEIQVGTMAQPLQIQDDPYNPGLATMLMATPEGVSGGPAGLGEAATVPGAGYIPTKGTYVPHPQDQHGYAAGGGMHEGGIPPAHPFAPIPEVIQDLLEQAMNYHEAGDYDRAVDFRRQADAAIANLEGQQFVAPLAAPIGQIGQMVPARGQAQPIGMLGKASKHLIDTLERVLPITRRVHRMARENPVRTSTLLLGSMMALSEYVNNGATIQSMTDAFNYLTGNNPQFRSQLINSAVPSSGPSGQMVRVNTKPYFGLPSGKPIEPPGADQAVTNAPIVNVDDPTPSYLNQDAFRELVEANKEKMLLDEGLKYIQKYGLPENKLLEGVITSLFDYIKNGNKGSARQSSELLIALKAMKMRDLMLSEYSYRRAAVPQFNRPIITNSQYF